MRPHGSAKTLEQRRRRAVELLNSGLTMEAVSDRVGTSIASVSRWHQAVAEGGLSALAAKPVPGRPRKLQKRECQRLLDLLLKGARAYGYPNELWTLKRIARVILREFAVRYHPNHVWRVLRELRWSCQVPERRPVQRDEEAVQHWKRYQWPHIKKGPRTWGPSGLP
jgi:transposase